MSRDEYFEWVTVKELADRRRVTARTVRDWIKRGKVDAERTAGEHGHWRIKVIAVNAS